MPLIKSLCLAALLFSFNTSSLAGESNSTVVSKQEQVLLELAELGVIESYKVLADFYADRATRQNNYAEQSIYWRVQAGQQGSAISLYKIGMYGLNFQRYEDLLLTSHNPGVGNAAIWLKEGLVLISEAAILGYVKAKVDLVMLPKFLPISNQDIEKAIAQALIRLGNGELVNCDLIKCPTQTQQPVNPGKLAKFQLAAANFAHERQQLNCHKLKLCLQLMLKEVKTINPGQIKQYQNKVLAQNAARVKMSKINRKRPEKLQDSTKNWQKASNEDRHAQRIQAAKAVVDQYASDDRKNLRIKIVNLLEKINIHRDKNSKIMLTDVMEILAQP